MDGTHSLNIDSLRTSYAKGEITPSAVVNQVYDRIESYPDKAVWIHLVPRERALEAAAGLVNSHPNLESIPPLYGVPFSIKDSIDIAGIPTTVGCPSYAYTPEKTAHLVQKILEAGGILIGKTNMDQFATGLTGHRSPYGTPRSVFDPDYIPGGSSSGSAVSVGSSQVSFSIGSDTAGSIRLPAVFNGVVGLKPTLGTVSTVGVVPACKTADCVSVLARSVESAREVWQVIKGYDEEDVFARPPQPIALLPFPKTIRFGIPPSDLLSVLSPSYAQLFSRCVDELSSTEIGLQKAQFDYSPFQSANGMLYGSSIVVQRLVAFDDYLKTHGMGQLHPVIKSIFESSGKFDAIRAYQDIFELALYKRQAAKQFETNIDVLVVPSTVTHYTVSEVEQDPTGTNKMLGSFTQFVNLLDLCAIAIPTGNWTNHRGNLMPFGITLIAPAGRDAELMDLGARIMEHCRLNPHIV
ncbi:amidase signature domain-containing protein [Aspergillus unguis]